MTIKSTSRIKVVLVEQNKTSKWLVDKLGMNESIISRGFTSTMQPLVDTLSYVAKLLNIDIKEFLSSTKTKSN